MRSHGLSGTNWSSHNAYHSDANGNVTALVNSSGVLQASYKYNPYGGLISSIGALASANTMRFSSKPAIFSSSGAWGFYYYGYRFYDPLNQRWLNRDPLGEAGGRNLYGFVGNRPTLAVDDYGNSPTLVTGAIGVGLGAVIGGGIAWWNGGDAMAILEGAGKGALIGGIAGLTGGAAAGLIGGTSIGAGIAAGALGGAVGDIAGQGVELALGWRCEYSWKQTALSVGLCGAAGGAGRYLARAGAAARSVETPYGAALQSELAAAQAARAQVQGGAPLYRVGTTGRSAAGEAQFWSLEHPLTPGFAARYGLPAENVAAADFIESAMLKPGTSFITRPAPGIGKNPGGGIEVVVPSGGVRLNGFHYSPNILGQ